MKVRVLHDDHRCVGGPFERRLGGVDIESISDFHDLNTFFLAVQQVDLILPRSGFNLVESATHFDFSIVATIGGIDQQVTRGGEQIEPPSIPGGAHIQRGFLQGQSGQYSAVHIGEAC